MPLTPAAMQAPLRRQTLHFLTTSSSRSARRYTSRSTSLTQRLRPASTHLPTQSTRAFTSTAPNMSFSNADTGNKPADPYTAKNLEEPSLQEKVEDLTAFIEKCKFCMMTTVTPGDILASRCMAIAGKEGNGMDLIFHTNTESGKTDDLDAHSSINCSFLQPSGEWASISGKATVETDREKVRAFYSPALKAWLGDLGDGKHDGGPEDPRIGVIKVSAKTAQYAVSRRTAIGGAVEFAKGVVTGETAQVNKLRRLEEGEIQQWRSS